ncbi:MAG TPA: hypothetical protein VFB22_13865 [Candidatus Baltobacteraceae bacterium]|nr:hypothetical protein [Candidatus Baltobacteraceae bacterium]
MEYYRRPDDAIGSIEIVFGDVEVYKCTYRPSLNFTPIRAAYDTLVRWDSSPLLRECTRWIRKHGDDPLGVQHYAIFFDLGPYYEVVCRRVDCSIDGRLVFAANEPQGYKHRYGG